MSENNSKKKTKRFYIFLALVISLVCLYLLTQTQNLEKTVENVKIEFPKTKNYSSDEDLKNFVEEVVPTIVPSDELPQAEYVIGSSVSRLDIQELLKKHFPDIIWESELGCPAGFKVRPQPWDSVYCDGVKTYWKTTFDLGLNYSDGKIMQYHLTKDIDNVLSISLHDGDLMSITIGSLNYSDDCFSINFQDNAVLEAKSGSKEHMKKHDGDIQKLKMTYAEVQIRIQQILTELCNAHIDQNACDGLRKLKKEKCY